MTPTSPRALRQLAGALLALAIVPAVAFAVLQGLVQSESEAQLAEIRDGQLDGLLFSVNQSAWDVASSWAEQLAWIRAEGAPTDLLPGPVMEFLTERPGVRAVVVADTALATQQVLTLPGEAADTTLVLAEAIGLPSIRRLVAQNQQGYRKLEPATLPGGRLGLVFVADGASSRDAIGPPRVLCMVIDPDPFVSAVVMPKLREVGRGGVALGVFRGGEPVGTTDLDWTDVERQRPLWLLPATSVGARAGAGSVEEALQRRAFQSLVLFGGVTLVLGAGAWFAWRGVRREVEVARLREDFVSNVSHELRTPLALIRMYAESLAEGRVPDDRKPRYYATLVAEAERLSRLVGNVLQFNRFERGTVQIAREPLDLGALVEEIAERYRAVVEREGCTLTVRPADGPLPVLGDRDALAESLVNLLDNAVKYGGAGPVEVSVRAEGSFAVAEVADRGPGIPVADRERVFDPFVRVQPESADGLVHTAKGTGLGLALVRRIAVAHGGTAAVRAREGGGSVFQIALPTHA